MQIKQCEVVLYDYLHHNYFFSLLLQPPSCSIMAPVLVDNFKHILSSSQYKTFELSSEANYYCGKILAAILINAVKAPLKDTLVSRLLNLWPS